MSSQPVSQSAELGAIELFTSCYGAAPDGVWHAPGRVNLIGEHTDYNDGYALPFAISAGIYVAAAARDDGMLALASRQYGGAVLQTPLAELAPGAPGGWAAYPAGMAWALLSAGHQHGGASLAIDADLAVGAGLASSAALECAAGLALTELYQLTVRRAELAVLGRRAENDFAGAPTGTMDQLAVLLCQQGHALLLDCRNGTTAAVPLDVRAAGLDLLVIDTRARHELTDGGYAARRRSCEAASRLLGVRSLRDVEEAAATDRLSDPVLRCRARHVVTENLRVLATAELLFAGNPSAIGGLLTASHSSLRDDFGVSWPEADITVDAAIGAGACGARMTGGGFGGSVIALVPTPLIAAVTAAIGTAFGRNGWRSPVITNSRPAQAARRIR